MNRRDLVRAIAEHTGQTPREADLNLAAFTDVVTQIVASGEPVAISGFAKFAKVETKARMGRNPQTGEAIQIKAKKKVRITPLKSFKDAVMAGRAPRKVATKKAAPAKKAAVKRAPAKKAPAKKTASRRR